MKVIPKILCLVVVATILVSIVCVSSSADSYIYDDTVGNYFTSEGRDFMGLPFHLSVDMGKGYYLNLDNYGSTLFDFYDADVSPSIQFVNEYHSSGEFYGVRSLLTSNVGSSDGTLFVGTSSYIVSYNVASYQVSTGFFSDGEDVVLDELVYLENISSPNILSGGGVPVFSYDGIISAYYLYGDNYFGRLPSYLNYDLLIDEAIFPIDHSTIDYSGVLGDQNFRFYLSCDVLSVDNGEFVSTPYNRTWIADPSNSVDYVRFAPSSGVPEYLAKNYFNQGADVNSITCRFNLRHLYHMIGDNFPDSFIKNLHIYIEPLNTLNNGNVSPLWNNSFIDRFSFIGIPTPCLGFGLEYSPISVGLNYDDYYDNFYNWLIDSGEDRIVIEQVSLNDFSLVDWLGDTLDGVFNAPLIGPITLASILYVVAGLGIVFIVLKIFFGG